MDTEVVEYLKTPFKEVDVAPVKTYIQRFKDGKIKVSKVKKTDSPKQFVSSHWTPQELALIALEVSI